VSSTDDELFEPGSTFWTRTLYKIGWSLVALPLKLWTRTTVSGREHLPTDGPFIVCPNHRSYLDTPYAALVPGWHRMRYMGKHTMFKIAWLRPLFYALGAFPVNRGSADREALKRAIQILNAGEALVLFPEGERKSGSAVQPLFEGAMFVAAKANVPMVPVGIGGSERVMPKGKNFIYPRKVHIEIGPPIPPPSAPDGKRVPREAYAEQTELLHAEMQRVFDLAMERVGWSYPITD